MRAPDWESPGGQHILRVFPRRTKATPYDNFVRFGPPDMLDPPEGCEEAHISVTFTEDLDLGRDLLRAWRRVLPAQIGGPACGDPGSDFTPGLYLQPGHVITSRGCPNDCWFCLVPRREGPIRELPISEGHIIHDSNILACSMTHIQAVFDMLARQVKRPVFAGGLEAARIDQRIANSLRRIKTDRLYCAYDTPDDCEPIFEAGKLLRNAGFTRHHLFAYVLIGYKGDTLRKATSRLLATWRAGFVPYAMLYDRDRGDRWTRFQRQWCRPAVVKRLCREATQ